jgi:hypothetical protein
MIPAWLEISLITAPCGVLCGVILQSCEETLSKPPGFMLFGDSTLFRLLASAVVNAILVLLLFIGPSSLLLNIFYLVPLYGNNHYALAFSLLGGVVIGKTVRWWRWKKTRDLI